MIKELWGLLFIILILALTIGCLLLQAKVEMNTFNRMSEKGKITFVEALFSNTRIEACRQ